MVTTAKGKLSSVNLEVENKTFANVVLVSGGYPESYQKEKIIFGLEQNNDSIVFHAGTKKKNNAIVTNGGRVLSLVSKSYDFKDALKKSYYLAEKIHFENKNFRKDLGFDL
jgi:phosphoribosylamine--glycine ligase